MHITLALHFDHAFVSVESRPHWEYAIRTAWELFFRNKIREFTTRTNFFGVLLPFFVCRPTMVSLFAIHFYQNAFRRLLLPHIFARFPFIWMSYSWRFVVAARAFNLLFLRSAVSFYEVTEQNGSESTQSTSSENREMSLRGCTIMYLEAKNDKQ